MNNFFSSSEEQVRSTRILLDQLETAVENLFYISETDSEIVPFSIAGGSAKEFTSRLLESLGLPPKSLIAEREFDLVFGRLTRVHEGANERAKQSAERFRNLIELIERNLKGIRVLAIGSIRVTLIIGGIDVEGNFTGVKTFAVET